MDNFIVSARKYRPATFDSVVGQLSITSTLKNAIRKGHLAHAYLFCGPRGVGKTTCARIFAKTINCFNPGPDMEPCDSCESCIAFRENRSYNIHELDAASNNSVEDIRIITDQVRIPPQVGKYSIYIIDEVHMLSNAAFNAFLKTLEEPPHHAIFILATTEKHKIIPTILSRCQIFDFNRIKVNDTVQYLEQIAQKEKIEYELDALNVIAQKADGAMRDALSIFDQIVSFSGQNITYKSTIENLNILDYDYYFKLTDAFLEGAVSQTLLIVDEIADKGFDLLNFVNGLSSHMRDLLVCKDPATISLLEVGASIAEKYKQQASRCPDNFIFKALSFCGACDVNFKSSRNPRLHVELTLLQICNIISAQREEAEKKNDISQVSPTKNTATTSTATPGNTTPTTPRSNQSNHTRTVLPSIKNIDKAPVKQNIEKPAIENKNEVAEPAPATSQNQTFTQQQLEESWTLFANEIREKDIRLYSTLTANNPVLEENYQINFAVSNPLQEEAFNVQKFKLLQYLCENLKNTEISINITVLESETKTNFLSPEEKFQRLAEKNPALTKLRQKFNLDFE